MSIEREVAELRSRYGEVESQTVSDDLTLLTMTVRGIPLCVILDRTRPVEKPPSVLVEGRWEHSHIDSEGYIRGLTIQTEWNRTCGLTLLVDAINQSFIEEPPRHA